MRTGSITSVMGHALAATFGDFVKICNESMDCIPRQNHKRPHTPFRSSVCRVTVVNAILARHHSSARSGALLKLLVRASLYSSRKAMVKQGLTPRTVDTPSSVEAQTVLQEKQSSRLTVNMYSKGPWQQSWQTSDRSKINNKDIVGTVRPIITTIKV